MTAGTARRLTFSIVILTFNRGHLLKRLLDDLRSFSRSGAEIIVVDNASDEPASNFTSGYPDVVTLRAPRNLGAAGRNLGFDAARGDVIVCLDDDVFGLSTDALEQLDRIFADAKVAAVNFKVLEEGTGRVVNWVHHREIEKFADETFDTYEITEGAVAFRRNVLRDVGGYPESFFLSHEGPDLAFRVMNGGWRVIYSPALNVTHSFAPEGRKSWRNYYFDTRNTLWLAVRNLPVGYGSWTFFRQTAAMFFYSIRDRHFRWWFKGAWDGLKGLPQAVRERRKMSRETMRRIREIDSFRPPLRYVIRKRLSKSGSMRL
ncbi:GT2 family glycosyltransferase [Povalibacter uvarum]|uniref:GT2 family glycosyltransferase n=1 Tax=Povalibacter uvarum TaxID=732238 RepID=A0A841HFU9_9GAMM|nr:glycosyltransferase [Povalibacter uvarum]MBB6091646.1 GT2 family glycosyltransferase [Povalibacter uvarum]